MLNTERRKVKRTAVHVAVGVILNSKGQVLISLRKNDQHQGGLWEFPGGKVEAGETCRQALARELNEELGIRALGFEPLIKIPHSYPDKSVILDVWVVPIFDGEPSGKEGQIIKWVDISILAQYQFPKANTPIIKAIQLPSFVAITGEFSDMEDFLFRIDRAIVRGAGLIQLRLPHGSLLDAHLLVELKTLCKARNIKVVVSSSIESVEYCSRVGLHLNSRDLMSLADRPVGGSVLLGASCHNKRELQQAERIGVDYAFLSPVNKTLSHEGAVPLGWPTFVCLAERATIPIYALGGLGVDDLKKAKQAGAQGVSAIGAFWG